MKMIQRAWRMELHRVKFVYGHFTLLPVAHCKSWGLSHHFSTLEGFTHSYSWAPLRQPHSSSIGVTSTAGPHFIQWDMPWDTEFVMLFHDPLVRRMQL